MTDELAAWLWREWEWDWFFTGTFAPPGVKEGRPPPQEALDRQYVGRGRPQAAHTVVGWSLSERRFDRWVGTLAQQGAEPYWFRAREPHHFRDATHFHALIGGVGQLRRTDAWREWFARNGQCRIEPIQNRDAVALYVAKYVTKADGQFEFSKNAQEMKRDRRDDDDGARFRW